MPRTIDEFAKFLVNHYAKDLGGEYHQSLIGTVGAGEFEVAAICVIEDAPVSADDIDELEWLSAQFDWVDRPIAERVIAKRRKEIAAAT